MAGIRRTLVSGVCGARTRNIAQHINIAHGIRIRPVPIPNTATRHTPQHANLATFSLSPSPSSSVDSRHLLTICATFTFVCSSSFLLLALCNHLCADSIHTLHEHARHTTTAPLVHMQSVGQHIHHQSTVFPPISQHTPRPINGSVPRYRRRRINTKNKCRSPPYLCFGPPP